MPLCAPGRHLIQLHIPHSHTDPQVSNTFGPAVSARALTLRQAVVLASITEFTGAVLAGAKVAGTIKNGIVSMSAFGDDAGVQMLGMTTALVASASWLMFCTINKWPVSTTYSLVAAMAGMGIALAGPNAPQWGWNNAKGLGAVFSGLGLAPAISGVIASVLYLIIKFAVLGRKDSFKAGLVLAPFLFFFVSGFMTLTVREWTLASPARYTETESESLVAPRPSASSTCRAAPSRSPSA